MRIAIAVVIVAACGGGESSPSAPEKRPADLVIEDVSTGGVAGNETITISAAGCTFGGATRLPVTDAQLDDLWSLLRKSLGEPRPHQAPPNTPDFQIEALYVSYGGHRYEAPLGMGVSSAIGDIINPEAPSDLAASLAVGGGIDGVGFTIAITGHDGTRSDTDGHAATFHLGTDKLDPLWRTILAADPATIATKSIILAPDTKVRVVTVTYGGKSYKFGGADQVAPADAPRVQAIADAITKLAPPP